MIQRKPEIQIFAEQYAKQKTIDEIVCRAFTLTETKNPRHIINLRARIWGKLI